MYKMLTGVGKTSLLLNLKVYGWFVLKVYMLLLKMSLWMRWEWDFLPLELNCCALPELTDWLMPNPSANHMLHVSLFLGKAVFACGKHFSAHFQHVKFDLVWFMWCCHSQLASERVLLPSILSCYTLSLRLFHSLVRARLFHSVLL